MYWEKYIKHSFIDQCMYFDSLDIQKKFLQRKCRNKRIKINKNKNKRKK